MIPLALGPPFYFPINGFISVQHCQSKVDGALFESFLLGMYWRILPISVVGGVMRATSITKQQVCVMNDTRGFGDGI